MDFLFILIVLFSASFSVFYAFRTRAYKKQGKLEIMFFYNAKSNISMGIMLISMALIQLVFFETPTGWRIGVGVIFLALGAFNLFIGVKNYKILLPQIKKLQEEAEAE